jgi:hypothetical protein
MNFLFLRAENLGCLDNATAAINCASLPSTVEKVIWTGTAGNLEYNNAPKIRSSFSDPTPYLGLVNGLMTILSSRSPALTLAQAQYVQTTLIDVLYNMKRVVPYTFVGHNWDATDDFMLAYSSQLAALMASGSSVNMSGLITPLNSDMAMLKNNFTVGGTASSGVWHSSGPGALGVGFQDVYNTNFIGYGYQIGSPAIQIPAGGYSASGAFTFTGTLSFVPVGETAAVAISVANLAALITNIGSRRGTLSVTRSTKKAQVAALATVAAVIAYDVTAGW